MEQWNNIIVKAQKYYHYIIHKYTILLTWLGEVILNSRLVGTLYFYGEFRKIAKEK